LLYWEQSEGSVLDYNLNQAINLDLLAGADEISRTDSLAHVYPRLENFVPAAGEEQTGSLGWGVLNA
jgi:hypothetical protein